MRKSGVANREGNRWDELVVGRNWWDLKLSSVWVLSCDWILESFESLKEKVVVVVVRGVRHPYCTEVVKMSGGR